MEFSQPTPKPAAEILKVVGELSGLAVDLTQLDTAAASRQPITLAARTIRAFAACWTRPSRRLV
ncbi:MAG: hypothetical protein U0992_22125 [Planctomycetaceae bacterium]